MAKQRVSLSKAQIQAGLGAELLTLCQSITEDGRLSKREIVELTLWLRRNRSSDLPAIAFLAVTVERIIADGRVTREEHDELYKAIETVLPPEARKEAVANRKEVEAEKRERDRPVASANFMVAGIHYEGRVDVIRAHLSPDDVVYLARDPGNRFSRNAIEVRLRNGMQIGYVPEDDARRLAKLLDGGSPHRAFVTKILTGGRAPIPVVQAYLHGADACLEGLVRHADIPEKAEPRKRRWWQLW